LKNHCIIRGEGAFSFKLRLKDPWIFGVLSGQLVTIALLRNEYFAVYVIQWII